MAGNNKLMATPHGAGKCVVRGGVVTSGYSLLTACVAIMISVMTITASRPIRNKNRPCMNCDSRKRNVLARRLQHIRWRHTLNKSSGHSISGKTGLCFERFRLLIFDAVEFFIENVCVNTVVLEFTKKPRILHPFVLGGVMLQSTKNTYTFTVQYQTSVLIF